MFARSACALLLVLLAPAMVSAQEERAMSSRTERAAALMNAFAERTGLTSERPPRRYLWTDAFAVANYIALARATGDESYRRLAARLVDQVHHTLGQHRADDPRTGWLDGASEDHPTRGGLRIGKPLPERRPGEPFDERLEWDRDGQYFHYLTRWMHALDLMARDTGEARYGRWARELAQTAHRAFVVEGPGGPRMVWKMSVDLSRPLVSSMGQHDPLDGWVTCAELQATRSRPGDGPNLDAEGRSYASMVSPARLATSDPLGIGGLLMDALVLLQLHEVGAFGDERRIEPLLGAARRGLAVYVSERPLDEPADRRLAFRELGLAIGLAAVPRIAERDGIDAGVRREARALAPFVALGEQLVSFWLEDRHRRGRTWMEHQDIDDVMLATALVPDGVLMLR